MRSHARKDHIPGGLADDKNPEDFDQDQLKMGIKVEMEHTDDPDIAKEIAMDHLTEIPDYYTRLKKMEDEAGGMVSANHIKDAIVKLLKEYPHPDDDQIHELADQLGLSPHRLEEEIYALLAKYLQNGKKDDGDPNAEDLDVVDRLNGMGVSTDSNDYPKLSALDNAAARLEQRGHHDLAHRIDVIVAQEITALKTVQLKRGKIDSLRSTIISLAKLLPTIQDEGYKTFVTNAIKDMKAELSSLKPPISRDAHISSPNNVTPPNNVSRPNPIRRVKPDAKR